MNSKRELTVEWWEGKPGSHVTKSAVEKIPEGTSNYNAILDRVGGLLPMQAKSIPR
jgi:hypothetical protein